MSQHFCSRCKNLSLVCSSTDCAFGMVLNPQCGCWKCPECGIDLRQKWLALAVAVFMMSGLWEVAVCTAPAFEALAKRIRNSGGHYFRIRCGTIHYVFHTPLVQTRKHKPDSSKWLNSKQVIEAFTVILDAPDVSRISCSRCLLRPKPVLMSKWKLEAIKRKSVGEFNHLLERLCIDERIQPRKSFTGKLVDVILLRGCPDMRKSNRPCISLADSLPEETMMNTQTIRSGHDEPEPSWDDTMCGTLAV